ncbi:MAG: carbamoyl-phosphate synthase large subunit [Spirochaetota bacterium]|nr:carbamoyl-phosphate synthase large subunit [Spirochaetota bacterium]
MPKRDDIKKILIIGAGPIIIGQACEFDYSGSQACKALKEEGYKVILINSNPATIMTDPNMADATYVEPITPEIIEKIIEKEKPDAILPTLGGQTGLNNAVALAKRGILEKHNVEMIGVNLASIEKAEDREKFKKAMENIGISVPRSEVARDIQKALDISKDIGFPLVIRPSFTMGGSGGSIAYNKDEFQKLAEVGLSLSPISEILIEESVLGWKEFELEVMRDVKDNVVIICSIENFDPMGIHTGDSITVAPQQTLSDKEYQQLRDYSVRIIREIGVDTGGSNIQFAVNPEDGRVIVIEMNPRVSRSSALASKATGFPIAKIAAKLAVGYTLDEIQNDITLKTKASFEPTLDYCVVKIPRWAFEKFQKADNRLSVQMKSVGEVMAIGRTFKEAIQKGLRALEIGKSGFDNELCDPLFSRSDLEKENLKEELIPKLRFADPKRIFYIKDALDVGLDIENINKYTGIDKWFLHNLKTINDFEKKLIKPLSEYTKELLFNAKRLGFSDKRIALLSSCDEREVRSLRLSQNIVPTYKLVDTCAAEFKSYTPYYYSTYEEEDEAHASDKQKVIIIGGGPNRIGQGIEFDYLCVQASYSLREEGFETIMINSNPETVSTDYDTSDKLYFEPLTIEDVLNIYEKEKPLGVIVQLGGQTPLNLAKPLEDAGVNILGTSTHSIDLAEDRNKFKELIIKNKLLQPENDIANSAEELLEKAEKINYPIVVRPSYVLGGRAMEIVYDKEQLMIYIENLSKSQIGFPILIDQFLQDALEVDVDAISDGDETLICGIMEHIEEAGIHSGDSACVLPPFTIKPHVIKELERQTILLAKTLEVKGLLNIQFAIKNDIIYFLEANPRGSRTVPFVSKATGVSWAKIASKIMLNKKLKDLNIKIPKIKHVSVKEAVLPFNKFPQEDAVLGPEMKSTGEVMGIDMQFGTAFAKSQMGLSACLPSKGNIFISVNEKSKGKIIEPIKILFKLGFNIIATEGTRKVLLSNDIKTEFIYKLNEGRPNLIDKLINGEIHLVVNTPSTSRSIDDGKDIRQAAIRHNVPLITTVQGLIAAANGIRDVVEGDINVYSLQELFRD